MKKTISVLLVCVLLFASFCGCSNTDTDKQTTPLKRTIFIYMCGSNLETKQGLASKNIDEILSAEIGNNVTVVIETGGASTWRHHGIDNNAIQRYEVKDGELKLIETLDNANMGEAQTLTDFLKWGQDKYRTQNNMLILWDHGGGSAKGVCFDENYGFDGLTLTELHNAFENAELNTPFEIIGFDACLMASIETVAEVKDYAFFMVASEEIEPAGGWDYKALAEAYAQESDLGLVGEKICYSYMDKCEKSNKDSTATLSVFDLSYADKLLSAYEKSIKALTNYTKKAKYASTLYDAISECEKFGGDNIYQGTANMLDILCFYEKIAESINKTEMMSIFGVSGDFVRFMVCGKDHPEAWGLSFYYPTIYKRDDIEKIIELETSESYTQYLKEYFLKIPDTTIKFTDMGSIASDGAFTVSLTPESKPYLSHIDYILMTMDSSGARHIISTDNDMDKDWDNFVFKSNFRGITLALDGHPMFYSTVSSNDRFISFSAPVILNGESTTLRFTFVWDESYFNGGYYEVTGTWYGYDENGLPDNVILPLKKGDTIQVVTDVVQKDGENVMTYGDEFTIGEDNGKITEVPLDGKEYQYVFVATDRYGNTFFSDMATFKMKYTYDELLANPLPDDSYAADVTNIEPYK